MEDSTEEDIESLIEGMAYIPGHFHVELNLNGEPNGPVSLRHRDTQLKRESLRAELEAETGRLQYAVRNMMGLLAFHVDEMETAEEAFHSICQEDPENLNAWANLGYVYERLGRELDEGECVERVAALMGPEMGENQTDCRLRVARCLAEQAYAHPHDVELERDEDLRERLTSALMLYNRSLDNGEELVSTSQILMYREIVHTVHIIMFWGSYTMKTPVITRKGKFLHIKTVHCCICSHCRFPQAIKLATDDAFILNRLANVFFLSGKLEMATGICNMALGVLTDAELNWQLSVTTYAKDLDKAKCGQGGIPDRQILKEARADLDRVLAVRPCLRTHLELGQVYYYMGVDALQESLLVDEMAINQAQVSLSKLLRGRCLLLKGEEQNAIDCCRKALELEPPSVQDTAVLRCLLQAILVSFTQSGNDTGQVIIQLEECLKQAEERYGANIVQTELKALCRAHTDEVTELSKDLVRKGRLEVVRKLLKSVQPQGKKFSLGRSMSI
uniref:Tetratricopeptide repeat domain 22 n=1 Tax=Sinocyclocheilus rhinocerous TaxID=307959 RepID=A0A673JGD9_9TELE